MKIWITALMTMLCMGVSAQSAKSVLDKAAATVSNKGGVSASFTVSGGQGGKVSGSISVKGRKFYAKTSAGTVWFDGKTQWTYVRQNDEVNVNNPSAAELQAINPYGFVYLYKQGYQATMTQNAQHYVVTLKSATKTIRQMVITIAKKTYVPAQVRMLQNGKWTTVSISGFKCANLSDGLFRFNRKAYPNAEIIDLR